MKCNQFESEATLHQIFSYLREEPDAVFLDSSLKNKYGQYSIIGVLPYLKLEENDGIFYVNGVSKEGDCISYLKTYMREHHEENNTGLPFVSGAIGYMNYDYGKKFMGLPHLHEKYIDMPDACFVFYRILLVEAHATGKITLITRDEEAEAWLLEIQAETDDFQREKQICASKVTKEISITSDFSQREYQDAIRKMINYIVEGDIYITNMTRQIQIRDQDAAIDPYAIFCELREKNPSPFGGYFHYNGFEIISASPERFFELRDGVIRTRPIKGTRKRGATPVEDEAMRIELEQSEKDRSELLMIVDLERNDLSRVCKMNSVHVEELFVTEAYATVFHLVSTISGVLREDADVLDAIMAMFPGGSITGAPKYRSMEIIDELERSRRMLYTGSIGYIGLDGNADFNIVIRTMVHQNGVYHLGVGGGITCESEPEFEYEETSQKALALLNATKRVGGLM